MVKPHPELVEGWAGIRIEKAPDPRGSQFDKLTVRLTMRAGALS